MRRSPASLRALARLCVRSSPAAPPFLPPAAAPFSSSSILLKKRKIAAASDSPGLSNSHPSDLDPENPLDLSPLTTSFAAADAHFKAELQQVLHGGRFNPDALGALPIPLKPTSTVTGSPPPPPEIFPLRELAQIVPRSGRSVSLLVNDRRFIRDIMSAVQKSPSFNQQPQRTEDNELELVLRVEPERKEDLARRVRESCRAWRDRVRQARTRHDKTLHEWRRAKAVLPDVVRRAEREVQKAQDKKLKEIDHDEAHALKQI